MAEPVPVGVRPWGVRLDHVGLAVADLDAAADWYGRALGYAEELRLRVEAIGLDIAMLIHPSSGDRLELLHRTGFAPAPRPADPAEAALRATFGHIAMDVTDLDAAFAHLLSQGARPVLTPRASPEPGVRMAFVADPEGNLVELLGRHPAPPATAPPAAPAAAPEETP